MPKQEMVNLIVRLSVVVQGQDMIQESTELRGKVLKHESMVICLFEISYLFLKAERRKIRV